VIGGEREETYIHRERERKPWWLIVYGAIVCVCVCVCVYVSQFL
jgi:hypothetical protein